MGDSADATVLLESVAQGVAANAGRLAELVYDQLRDRAARMLRSERSDHTLQPTALVHEAFIKMVDQTRVDYLGRTHFLAIAAIQMRRILVDHARKHRGAVPLMVTLLANEARNCDVIALDDALQALAKDDERAAKVVELSVFGGLNQRDIATILNVAERTVRNDWTFARTWLRRAIERER